MTCEGVIDVNDAVKWSKNTNYNESIFTIANCYVYNQRKKDERSSQLEATDSRIKMAIFLHLM